MKLTFDEMRNEALFISTDHLTLPCHTDRSQYIVAGTHNITNPSLVEFRDNLRGSWFQLILENNEANKLQVTFSISAGELLDLHPAQFSFVFRGARNHSISFMGIMVQEIIIVGGK